jgi:hypothetical protein
MDEKLNDVLAAAAALPEPARDALSKLMEQASDLAVRIPEVPGLGIGKTESLKLTILATMARLDAIKPLDADKEAELRSSLGMPIQSLLGTITEDIDRMADDLVQRGFPDPRLRNDGEGWRIIARMVACDPDAFIEDIYETAIAKHLSTAEGNGLPYEALKAIVDGGMAGVFTQAGKLSAAQRHSKTMMEMLKKDSRYYAWTVEDWVAHLKAGKKTVLETDAWDHIKGWRQENKREKLGE